MKRLIFGAITVTCLLTSPMIAQSIDDLNIQFHGYATQGFLYSTHNDAFYARTTNGSPA